MNEALQRLSSAAGIEHGYWDGLGNWRGLDDTTAAALLRSLALDPEGDLDAQVQRLERNGAADGAVLPPVLFLRTENGFVSFLVVDLVLPQPLDGTLLRWELALESGTTLLGEQPTPAVEHSNDVAEGRGRARCQIDFGAQIPLGYHRFRLPDHGADTALIVAPARCFIPAELAEGGRRWGVSLLLYSLRSARNWGIGDFTDLADVATIAGAVGASVIGLNPLHARHLSRPDEASPYSPSSRLFLDISYLDVEAIADFADSADAQAFVGAPEFQSRLATLRNAALVDHRAVTALKLSVLERVFSQFVGLPASASEQRVAEFAEFRLRHGIALARFAEFEALRLQRLHAPDGDGISGDWHHWPPEWRDPESPALARFRLEAARHIEFQMYLQWQAEVQLDRAAAAARAAGMQLVLYRDLAVGASHDSAENWGDQALIAHGISVGAPPDLLSRNGQNWGLPPWNPRALAARAYRPFAALLAANMRGAGALRIDHVMALIRLFWIPTGMPGTQGGYVRSPFDALTAIVALESVRNRCIVIGEDLGSVPDGLRERLHDLGFLSYRVLIFERHWHGDGGFKRPWEYPAQSLAMVATHDMPTIADYWQGTDITRRERLGLYADGQARELEAGRRHSEREKVLWLLGELGLSPGDPGDSAQITEALHAAIARTPAMLAVVQLDDLLGEIEPANIPGTHHEYPNWRRKLSAPIEGLAADPRLARLAGMMRENGRS